MFDDSSGPSGVSFNQRPLRPIQQDDRTVNRSAPEHRDRGRFQKVLKSEHSEEAEEDDDLGLDPLKKPDPLDKSKMKGDGFTLDYSLKEESPEELMSLLDAMQEGSEKEPSLNPFRKDKNPVAEKEAASTKGPFTGLHTGERKLKADQPTSNEANEGTGAFAAGSEGENIAIGHAEKTEKGDDFNGSSGSETGFGSGSSSEEKDKIKQGLGTGHSGTSHVFVAADAKTPSVTSIGGLGGGSSGAVKDAEAARRTEMWELMEKLVDTIVGMKSEGKIETTVTLNEPKLFQGAVIKIVEFDQAKGQFNIAFQNLSPEAKGLLDANASKESLKRALEERGYLLHIMTTSLDLDKPKATEAQSQPFYQQERQGRGQQQQQQSQQEKKQQETEDDDF